MWINILNISDFEIHDDRLYLYNKNKFMLANIDIKPIRYIEMVLSLKQLVVSIQGCVLYLYTDDKLGKRIMKEVEKYKENEGIKNEIKKN